MLYRQKKDTHIHISNGHGYITSTGLNKSFEVDQSGSVFLNELKLEPQTLDEIVDKLLKIFAGADREVILPDAQEFYDNLVSEGFLVKGETIAELDKLDTSCQNIQPAFTKESLNFYLPGLDWDFLNFYVYFAKYTRKHAERFMEKSRIASFYGTFRGTIWAGGRISIGATPSPVDMENAIHKINDAGVAVRYTFTNSVLEERHLSDTFCNLIMELADNGKNEVLVNSSVLENYLRKSYPNFKYIQSITAVERNIDKINEATKKYDLVVIDFHDNHNHDFLNKIQDKDKIEILVNGYCPSTCTFSKQHYKNISRINCHQGNIKEGKCLMQNRAGHQGFFDLLDKNKDTTLTFDDVYKNYYDMGFRHFKLVGREEPSFIPFEALMYYFSKPEWRERTSSDLAEAYIDYLIKARGGNIVPQLDTPVKIKPQ